VCVEQTGTALKKNYLKITGRCLSVPRFLRHNRDGSFLHRGIIMANTNISKERPAGVPEENTYNSVHWSILLGYALAAAALYLLLFAG